MLQKQPVIVEQSYDVERELGELGLTAGIVRQIAETAAAAKAEALPIDPVTAAGTNAYHAGVRQIRRLLLPKGWKMSRNGNIEATVNHALGIQVLYQNVDIACGPNDPQAISKKGAGARKLVQAGLQGELFQKSSSQNSSDNTGVKPVVWLVCVSSGESTGIQAEVSCPDMFDGEQFDSFSKRIFVVNDDADSIKILQDRDDNNDGGVEDFNIRIAKK